MFQKIRYPLTIVLFWIIIVLIGFLVENIALLSPAPREGLSLNVFILISFVLAIVIGYYFVLEHKKNGLKINWIIAVILLGILVMNVAIIFSQPASTTLTNPDTGREIEVVFRKTDKLIYSAQLFFTLVAVYILVVPFKRTWISLRMKKYIYWAYIIYAFITVGLSFMLDRHQYVLMFTSTADNVSGVQSFYTNPNFYGFGMMMAVMALLVLQIHKPKFYNTIFMGLFTFAGMFSGCGATTLISIFLFGSYFIIDTIVSLRKRTAITLAKLGGLILFTWIVVMVCLYLYQRDVLWVKTPLEFFRMRYLESHGAGFLSLKSRFVIWDMAKKVMFENTETFFFGKGFKTGSWFMHCYYGLMTDNTLDAYSVLTSHSTFFEIMVRFGMIGFLIYCAAILYLFGCLIALFVKKEVRFALIFTAILIGILLHGLVESTFFFEGNTKGLTMTIMFYVPVISEVNKYRDEEETEKFVKETKPCNVSLESRVKITSAIFMCSTICITTLLASRFTYTSFNSSIAVLIALGVSLFLLLIAPYLIGVYGDNPYKKRRIFVIVFTIFVFLAFNSFVIVFAAFQNETTYFPYFFFAVVIAITTITLAICVTYMNKVNPKDYFRAMFNGAVVDLGICNLATLIGGSLLSAFLSLIVLDNSMLSQAVIVTINVVIYITLYIGCGNYTQSKVFDELNNNIIYRNSQTL